MRSDDALYMVVVSCMQYRLLLYNDDDDDVEEQQSAKITGFHVGGNACEYRASILRRQVGSVLYNTHAANYL